MTSPIKKGNPFKPNRLESIVLKGLGDVVELRREAGRFHCGDVGSCQRRAVKYLVTERRDAISPSSMAYMTIGSAVHEMVTDALFKSNRLLFKEYKIPPMEEPDLRGMVDAIIFGPDDKIGGLEIKTCGNLPPRPREEHEIQTLLYSALTGFDFHILYLSRKVAGYDGKLMLRSFEVEADDGVLHNAMTRACLAHYAYMDGLLPEIPPTFTRDKDCRFCPFADECWDAVEEDLPTATSKQMNSLYTQAELRAREIIDQREDKRVGILKHIERYATPEVQKKLRTISW